MDPMAPGESPFAPLPKPGQTSRWGFVALLQLWFGLSRDVKRPVYLITGLGLMAFKYVVEAGLIYFYTDKYFAPHHFLNPLLSIREQEVARMRIAQINECDI